MTALLLLVERLLLLGAPYSPPGVSLAAVLADTGADRQGVLRVRLLLLGAFVGGAVAAPLAAVPGVLLRYVVERGGSKTVSVDLLLTEVAQDELVRVRLAETALFSDKNHNEMHPTQWTQQPDLAATEHAQLDAIVVQTLGAPQLILVLNLVHALVTAACSPALSDAIWNFCFRVV